MTPKEKAIELIDKFKLKHKFFTNSFIKTTAKQCALIAVDEILNSNPNYPEFKENEGTPIRYWEVVKQEIENL
jgi:hypothetical protein